MITNADQSPSEMASCPRCLRRMLKSSKEYAPAKAQRVYDGVDFLSSTRGKYIVAQALYYGIQALESVTPEVMQEKSNIDDMKFLQETLFTIPTFVFAPADAVLNPM